jgi:hypothetical protein
MTRTKGAPPQLENSRSLVEAAVDLTRETQGATWESALGKRINRVRYTKAIKRRPTGPLEAVEHTKHAEE